MQWVSIAAGLLAFAGSAAAQQMMRFQCSQLTIERLDPLVQPGSSPSQHTHQIVGGNSFAPTMNFDPSTRSTCTTCDFSQDFSNYWTANMYFRARNGTFKRVPQMANIGLYGNGGITVYYIPPYDGSSVTAFAPGFRMVVGNPSLRSQAGMQQQICHRCFRSVNEITADPPCTGSNDTPGFPTQMCPGGIRSTVTFPTCWDGVTLDPADHKSHVTYPQGWFEFGSPCPSSHPVKLPQVMYEIMWDTRQFNDPNLWPTDGSQPFVYSYGDSTGYGQHGDYLFGWVGDSLQRALNARCNLNYCSQTPTQSFQAGMSCTKPQTNSEDVEGWLSELPGGMKVT